MTTMEFWYDLAIREPEDLNEEATERLREAEEVLFPAAEQADEPDE